MLELFSRSKCTSADSVLRKQFSGDMVSAKPRLISDFASGGGGVWGGILRLLHPFSFGEIRGGQKYKYIIPQNCLGYFSASDCPSLKEIHPRHSPRVFPLWLLAPRCLCVSKAHASWGEEVSSPRVGLLLEESTLEKFRPRHPRSTLCICMFVVSLSLLNFCEIYNFGAHPLAMDAHSGNARGGIHACPEFL